MRRDLGIAIVPQQIYRTMRTKGIEVVVCSVMDRLSLSLSLSFSAGRSWPGLKFSRDVSPTPPRHVFVFVQSKQTREMCRHPIAISALVSFISLTHLAL